MESEAIAAEKLNHINIPRLYDFGLQNGELIYVSEYCEGHTASAWVGARGPLSTAAVLRVALQVVDAMNATAFQHLYHPALNPDNILFVAGQTVEGDWPPIKVLHWVGPLPELSGVSDGRVGSTTRFAAPEQLGEGKVDVRSEIYSLGATMWFLLTATPSPEAGSGGMKAEMARLRGVPKIVRHLLGRMLRHDPLERPQDPVALANYLQTCLARLERRTKIERRFGIPITPQPRIVRRKARWPIPLKPLAWATLVLCLAAIALMFLPWSSANRRSTPVARQTAAVPRSLPDEIPVVKKDSLGRIGAAEENVAPPAVVAATEVPRNDPVPAASPAAKPVVATASEPPRDEFATTNTNSPAPGPSASEEGLGEPQARPIMAANRPENMPASSPHEAAAEEASSSPYVAETSEVQSVAAAPPPAEDVAPVMEKTKSEADESETRPPGKAKTTLVKHSSSKRKSESVADRSRSHATKKRDRIARSAKRSQLLPKLRVGSAPAELVGTTSDGRWILSVEDTGRRVIVPPPPGYGP